MIPKEIKVGAQRWKVKVTDGLNEEMGTTDPNTHTIHISSELCEMQQESTLLHEILHVCCRFGGINDSKKYTEEEFISHIESALHSILKQNKL